MWRELFSPKGQISGQAYWRSFAALYGLFFFSTLLFPIVAALSNSRIVVTLGSYVLLAIFAITSWGYFCLFAKKLKSIDVSIYWAIVPFVLVVTGAPTWGMLMPDVSPAGFGRIEFVLTRSILFLLYTVFCAGLSQMVIGSVMGKIGRSGSSNKPSFV